MYIPNLLTFFRFLLIPVFVVLYWTDHQYLAVGALALSILSDFLDGKFARKLNQVSEIGILLDPVADKLTQGTIVICLAIRYPVLWWLLAVEVLKEGFMAVAGLVTARHKRIKLGGASWYGKVGTAITDLSLLVMLLFPQMDPEIRLALVVFCAAWMLAVLMLYAHKYYLMWQGHGIENDITLDSDEVHGQKFRKEQTEGAEEGQDLSRK